MDDETWEKMRRLNRHDRAVTFGFRFVMVGSLIGAVAVAALGLVTGKPHWEALVVIQLVIAVFCYYMARREPALIEIEEDGDDVPED